MTLPRTPSSGKKKKKNTPKKKLGVPEKDIGSGDDKKKEEVTPVRKQLEEQRRKQKIREMEEKLKALVQQRGAVKGKLTRVKSAIAQGAGVPNSNLRKVNFFKLHLETVKSCYTEYNGFQNEIYTLPLSEEQKEEHEGKYEEFELLYNQLVIELSDLLDDVTKPAANAALVSVPAANVVLPNYLPPLNVPLPKFDGTFETWYSFKSMFQNIMARYPNEAPAIKWYHLRDALVGKAAGVIDRDIVNNNDYDAAWTILEETYGDRRAIIDRHIENIFALPEVTRDNAVELRKLIDTCVKNTEGLKSLQLPTDGLGEQMLVNLLACRMNIETRRAWEAQQKVGVLPTYAATITFLKERCRILERSELRGKSSVKPQKSVALMIASEANCSMCNQQHVLKNCKLYIGKSVNEKYRHLRKHGLCFNCLKKGHRVGECTSTNSCQRCSKRHHTMLHSAGTNKQETAMTDRNSAEVSKLNRSLSDQNSSFCTSTKKQVMLPTAVVQVCGENGVPHLCRTLIDSCSQNHFVTERFANLLAAKKESADYQVSGLSGETVKISHLVRATVKSRVGDFSADLELLEVPKITGNVPVKTIDVSGWNLTRDIEFADPNFNKRGQVDMLLGAELFWDLIKVGKIKLAENLPVFRETKLGWVVGGAVQKGTSATVPSFCEIVKNENSAA